MSLGASGSALEGYRLKRVADDEPGFFTVYECTVGPDDEPVSVRAFPVPGDRRARRAFRRSARERAERAHPGLLPVRDVLESDGRLYLVTETVAAPTLAARLAAGPLEPRAAARALGAVAAALDGVNWVADGILDPSQIVFVERRDGERALLLDPAKASSLREAGWPWVHPYPHYAAPELGWGEHLGGPSVAYSLGCMLFECVSGSPPFEGDWLALVEAHSAGPIPRVSERRKDLPAALDSVLARAMAKDPAERFGSGRDLLRAAAAALDDDGGGEGPPARRGAEASSVVEPELAGELHPDAADTDAHAPPAEPSTRATAPARTEDPAETAAAREAHPDAPASAVPDREARRGSRSPSDNDPPAPRPPAIDPHPDAESAREPEAERAEAEPAREEAQPAREETERLEAKRAQAERTAPEPAVVSSWHPSPRSAAAPSEPAVEEPRRLRSRRRRNAILASVVAAACAVGGYLVGEAAKPPREPVKVVTAGALALELPADWERRPVPRVLSGVTLRDAVAAGPGGTPETGMVAGMTQRTGDDLLPNRLGPARVPAAEPVRLGRHEAHRHRDLGSHRAGRHVTAYSIPTEAGTVVVACHAATAAARSFMAGCERVASTLELRGLRPVSLGAGFAERGRLARTVARLRRVRDAGRRRLAAADTPAQQAREARALRAAYAAARPAFAKLDAAAYPARWKTRVLIVLRRIERFYGRLGAAAARRSRSGYTRAGRRVTRWEAGLQRLLAAASR